MRPVAWNYKEEIRYEFTHTIPHNFWWLKSIQDFIYKYKTKSWGLNKQYIPIYSKLVSLWNNLQQRYSLQVDPVVYIHFLYYWNKENSWVWLRDLSKRLLGLWIDLGDSKSVWKLLARHLEFPLRNKHEKTEVKNKKDRVKGWNLEIHKYRKEQTQAKVDSILSQSNIIPINIVLNGTKKEQIGQILFRGNIIPVNNIYELSNFIKWLYNSWLWGRRVAQVIKQVIDSIYPNNNIKLDPKEVSDWSKIKKAE